MKSFNWKLMRIVFLFQVSYYHFFCPAFCSFGRLLSRGKGRNLRYLELNDFELVSSEADVLNSIFEYLTQLEMVKLDKFRFSVKSLKGDVAIENLKPHNLPRLKSVILCHSDLNVSEYLKFIIAVLKVKFLEHFSFFASLEQIKSSVWNSINAKA